MANDPEIVSTTPISPRRRKSQRRYRLAPRDIKFATLALEYKDATKAYLEVIARNPDMEPHNASVCASRMMARLDIREFIRVMIDDAATAAGVNPTKVIARAVKIAFADWTLIVDTKGKIKPFHEWPAGYKELVTIEYEVIRRVEKDKKTGKRKRVEVGQKMKVKVPKQSEGLEILARYFKLLGNNAIDPNADKFVAMTIGGEANWDAV